MPALVNKSVGSFCGTIGELFTRRWPRSSKNLRKAWRIWAPERGAPDGGVCGVVDIGGRRIRKPALPVIPRRKMGRRGAGHVSRERQKGRNVATPTVYEFTASICLLPGLTTHWREEEEL